jgi:alpha-D-xyloside xylohydrolase
VLRAQIPAGLNIAMSGIPWWTTDIGGFMEGDIRTDYFKELIVRWFQYGVFCPLFRLHGVRLPLNGLYGAQSSGAGNEVWSFGEKAYAIIKDLLFLREKLKPYLRGLNRAAHEHGAPPMRPLYFDFPNDPAAANLADQFMLGRGFARGLPARRGGLGGGLDRQGVCRRTGVHSGCAAGAHPGLLAQGQPGGVPIWLIFFPNPPAPFPKFGEGGVQRGGGSA